MNERSRVRSCTGESVGVGGKAIEAGKGVALLLTCSVEPSSGLFCVESGGVRGGAGETGKGNASGACASCSSKAGGSLEVE